MMNNSLAHLGLGGEAALADEVRRLRVQVAQLLAEKSVGNVVYGGPIKTAIATSLYTVGPFVRDFDSAFPAVFDLLVPDNTLRLIRCQLRLKPRPIRSSVSVAATGGTTVTGSGAHKHGIGNKPTNSADTGHLHSLSGVPTDNAVVDLPAIVVETTSNSGTPHTHGVAHDHEAISHNHTNGDLAVNSNAPFTHSHVILAGQQTDDDADHTHPIATHSHALTLAIAEGSSPANVRLHINGVDRSAALGGPWGAAAQVEITPYLLDSLGRPVTGVHEIKFTTTSIGAIEAFLDFYVVAKPI